MNEPTITAEDLSLYALQLLEGDEATRVEVLLRSSSEAREELSLIRGDLAAFALATEQQTPPAPSRQRLMKQVARERRTVPIPMMADQGARYQPSPQSSPVSLSRVIGRPEQIAPEHRGEGLAADPLIQPVPDPTFQRPPSTEGVRHDPELRSPALSRGATAQIPSPESSFYAQELPQDTYAPAPDIAFRSFGKAQDEPRSNRFASIFGWAGWAAAAAFAVATVVAVRQNYSLQDQMHRQTATLAAANSSALKAQTVLQTLQSSAAQRFVLARTDTAPVPSGRVAYLPERGSLVFQASNLEALPAAKTYELWLIPVDKGGQPIAAGTFKPDARGYASVVLPELPRGTVAGNFGVTIEEDGGSASPTLPILLIGQQS